MTSCYFPLILDQFPTRVSKLQRHAVGAGSIPDSSKTFAAEDVDPVATMEKRNHLDTSGRRCVLIALLTSASTASFGICDQSKGTSSSDASCPFCAAVKPPAYWPYPYPTGVTSACSAPAAPVRCHDGAAPGPPGGAHAGIDAGAALPPWLALMLPAAGAKELGPGGGCAGVLV